MLGGEAADSMGAAMGNPLRRSPSGRFDEAVDELLLVPMLFALPAKAVPLVVVIGLLVGDLPDYLSGRRHVLRAVHALGDAWHSVGPALVLALFASGGPEWSSWPIYVGALGAQLFVDLTTSTAREQLG